MRVRSRKVARQSKDMSTQSPATLAVYSAISQVNQALRPEDQLTACPSQAILGPQASLDSLGLVQLLVSVENELERAMGLSLSLTFELTQPEAGVSTIGELIAFIEKNGETTQRAAS